MSAIAPVHDASAVAVGNRVGGFDWSRIASHLDAHGWALLPTRLTADECSALAGLYGNDRHFRSHIVMARHGFGRGEYKYFAYPLPDMVVALRTALYARLGPIANEWNAAMGIDAPFPGTHAEFILRCHKAGSQRILAEPFGTRHQDDIILLDSRVEKRFNVGERRTISAFVDGYNLTNSNPAQNINWTSGATFMTPSTIVAPRILRFGVRFEW
jgi:hypothetical protein